MIINSFYCTSYMPVIVLRSLLIQSPINTLTALLRYILPQFYRRENGGTKRQSRLLKVIYLAGLGF